MLPSPTTLSCLAVHSLSPLSPTCRLPLHHLLLLSSSIFRILSSFLQILSLFRSQSPNQTIVMPTWWVRKSGKNKDDSHHLLQTQTRSVSDKSIRRISADNKSSPDPVTPSRCTPRCSREFAGGASGFSDEKRCHPLPLPSLSASSVPSDQAAGGSVSGSASVSSVSSSGSAEDQSQPTAPRFDSLLSPSFIDLLIE